MPLTKANGVDIFYDEFGSPGDPAVLLVSGYGAQMISWDERFCEMLAGNGFRVIRYDNRDCGLSVKTEGPSPSLQAGGDSGLPSVNGGAPYSLADMAADGIGLLDTLGVERANVVGASMGGMIVQHMAFGHPDRVATLTSIMSTTGSTAVGQPTPAALAALLTPPPKEREAYLEHSVKTSKAISGPLFDPVRARERAARSYDRSFYPAGSPFQMAAIMTDGDRTERLASVRCPTLVIHGRVDPLVGVSGGEATSKAIAGAEFVVFDEMGHDQPPALFSEFTALITKLAASA